MEEAEGDKDVVRNHEKRLTAEMRVMEKDVSITESREGESREL